MNLHWLWELLQARVKAWRADSGFSRTREHQRKAQQQMWAVICRWSELQVEISSDNEVRFWLLDVSSEMSSCSTKQESSAQNVSLVIRDIPCSLAPWQMVVLDRLRFTGVEGVTAEIRRKPDDSKSWWVTLTWTAPALLT